MNIKSRAREAHRNRIQERNNYLDNFRRRLRSVVGGVSTGIGRVFGNSDLVRTSRPSPTINDNDGS